MRKVKIILPILILFAGILLYLQFGRDVEVISTTSTTSDQFYEQGMTVVANSLSFLIKSLLQKIFWIGPGEMISKKFFFLMMY